MTGIIETYREKTITGQNIDFEDAMKLYAEGREYPHRLMAAASEIREHFKGKAVVLCGIVNAKSGRCTEDCKFCAQSVHYDTDTPIYPLVTSAEMVKAAVAAKDEGVHMFGIITSGTEISTQHEWSEILRAISGINRSGIRACASLGMLDVERARSMKEAGLFRYHHNLETARSFFGNICTTHEYDEDIRTVEAAKAVGLSVCCGGIVGMGETMQQRLELAFTLKGLDVDCIPVNILNPRPGTPFADIPSLSPIEILLTIALFRFILPDKDIKLCGGKERNLRQLLPLGIVAGCNSLMTGNYLTTPGRNTNFDIEMIEDLGLSVQLDG